MRCAYFDAGACRSCDLMGVPYVDQLAGKQRAAEQLVPAQSWSPPLASDEDGFRSKAKMVVGGTSAAPTIGILDAQQRGVDLRECGVCSPGIRAAFPALAAFIGVADLTPYDVSARRGELKHLVLVEAPDGALTVRFVLRSTAAVPRVRKHLPWLLERLPQVAVASVNLQPEHKAIVEGPQELVLTEAGSMEMRLGEVVLHVRPGSFVQTNTAIARALYLQAREWVDEAAPASVWDLYCGVGGFALHVAAPGRRVLGVEVSPEAIESARMSSSRAGGAPSSAPEFLVGDATAFAEASAEVPDLVIVNPPRRGLGDRLADWLERRGPATVVYSSCNAVTLARDLERMPSYAVRRARLVDMFPQTSHFEVIALLQRTA